MQKTDIDMVEGPLFKGVMKFTIPLIASNLIQILFNATDVAVVGHFGSQHSLAAVGSVVSYVVMVINFLAAFTVGVNVLISLHLGQRKFQSVSLIAHSAMMIALIGGTILTIFGLFCSKIILQWMGTPEVVLPLSLSYTRICFCGMIPVAIYNFGASLLYSKGDTKHPFYFLVSAGILNVILNLIFVICFKMDVAGVALATVLSQCVSASLIIIYLMKQRNYFQLCLAKIKFNKSEIYSILKMGFPAGIQSLIFNISNVVIQGAVNSFGAVFIAGSAASHNIEFFIWIAINSFQATITTFTSHNIGAKNFKRIDTIRRLIVGCEVVIGAVLGGIVVLFGPYLLQVYTSDPEIISAGMMRLRMVAGTYFICGSMDALSGALRGMGTTLIPMIVCMICACGLRVLWIATLFQSPEYHSFYGLFFSYPLSWLVASVVLYICCIQVRKRFPKE
ncbi:MAG: MATE family efflux transporter [Alphaproteobacteria bacterium]|nr:MATE family efflux transporter [Alphaproteobacteria bacterium]